jgi:hypothetical protein
MLLDRTLFLGFAVVVITGIVLLILRHPRVSGLFVRHIPERPKRRLFLAAISFFLTFSLARSLAYSNYHHLGPSTTSTSAAGTFITWCSAFCCCWEWDTAGWSMPVRETTPRHTG